MRFRVPGILAICLVALLLAKPLSYAQTATTTTILFEILGEEKGKIPAASTIEPLVLIENGHLKKPVEYDYNKQKESDAAYNRFEKEYFERGRKYPLLIGGTKKGFVTVRGTGRRRLHLTGCYGREFCAVVECSIRSGSDNNQRPWDTR